MKPTKSTPFFIGVYSETSQPENIKDFLQLAVTGSKFHLPCGVKLSGAEDDKHMELVAVNCDHPARALAKL